MKGFRIAVGCQARVGKDTFADYVNYKYGCKVVKFATNLYKITDFIQQTFGLPIEKDPILLQMLGGDLRKHFGDNVFVDSEINRINKLADEDPDANIIITDMRYPNELAAVKEMGFTTIRIIKPDRVIDRDPNSFSETALLSCDFDYVIVNDGSIEDFYKKIDCVLMEINF